MASSRGEWRRRGAGGSVALGVLVACAAAGALLGVSGCSHAAATPPTPPPAGARASGARAASTPAAAVAPNSLDPSEVMTAAELASIPDPVPGDSSSPPTSPGATTAPGSTAAPPAGAAPAPTAAAGTSAASAAPDTTPTPPPGAATWRVQIFASPDLAQADSVAKDASARLGVAYSIEFEGSLYKVRLGAFASEQEAQSLRERAVEAGYSGAFRMRSTMPVIDNSK